MIKTLVIKLFERLGYEIIPSSRIVPSNLSQHLQALFERFGIDCVLDVGANVGQYASFLRSVVGYRGLIISFEPVRENVSFLNEKSRADPKWEVYDFALGAENTEKAINVMRAPDLSSFLEPDDANTRLFSQYNAIHHSQVVEIKTVDSIFDDLKARHQIGNVYIKLDTQGYDFQVILGAEKTLEQVLAVQMELSVQSIYRGAPSYWDIFREMNKRGYDLSGVFATSQDSLLRLIEIDCILINGSMVKGAEMHLMRGPDLMPPALLPES